MTGPAITLRNATPDDLDWAMEALRDFGSPVVIAGQRFVDLRDHPARIAEIAGERVGVLFHILDPPDLEALVLRSLRPRQGVGRALMRDVIDVARQAGCNRVHFTTTNDNIPARRLHESVGYKLVAQEVGGFAKVLRLMGHDPKTAKMIGYNGQPITDILSYEYRL